MNGRKKRARERERMSSKNVKTFAPINVLLTALHNNCIAAHALSFLAAGNLFHYFLFLSAENKIYIFICHFFFFVVGHHTCTHTHKTANADSDAYILCNASNEPCYIWWTLDSISSKIFHFFLAYSCCRSIAFKYDYVSDCIWILNSLKNNEGVKMGAQHHT